MMDYEYFHDKRRDQKKYLRLKIITNRQINFITAIRYDSTVTDLANRALNVYLELSGQYGSKKQLTVAAVKQGRYFMPKSQIVSNLISQDEEAKPKFPKQHIPNQHDYQLLTKHIKNFDNQFIKRRQTQYSQNSTNIKNLFDNYNKPANQENVIRLENQSEKVNQQNQGQQNNNIAIQQSIQSISNLSDSSQNSNENQQIQFKGMTKKEIKKMKRMLKDKKNIQKVKNSHDQNRIISQKIQTKTILNPHKNVNQIIQSKSIINQDKNPNIDIVKSQLNLKQNNNENSFDNNLKKKMKLDNINKNVNENNSGQIINYNTNLNNISRKGSLDNRSQKTPKSNLIQSPKVTFHFQTKNQSPKVLYVPESKNLNELMANIQKQKQKIKLMSPLMLAKSSPKISIPETIKPPQSPKLMPFSQNLIKKSEQQSHNKTNFKKNIMMNTGKSSLSQQINLLNCNIMSKQSIICEQNQINQNNVSFNEQKNQKKQPQIIEEESSESEEIFISKHQLNQNISNSTKSNQKQKYRKKTQNDIKIIKRNNQNNQNNRFYQIQMKINKFKLEESSEENN